jgi:trigger factor
LISEACKAVVKDIGATEIAISPTYRVESRYSPGGSIVLSVHVETVPSFELSDFKGKVNKIVPDITDEEIADEKEAIIKAYPVFEKAEKDYVIEGGDRVSYTVKCIVNGAESKKRSYANDAVVPIDIQNCDDYVKHFVGLKARESFEYSPEDEKGVVFITTINTIRKRLTDLTDEQYALKKGFSSLDDFLQTMRKRVESDINKAAFLYHKQQVLDMLANEYTFELPETIVRHETRNVIVSIRRELEREKREGIVNEEDLKKTDEDFAEEYEDVIRKRVLLGYVLNKFAQRYDITVDRAEIEKAIMTEMIQSPDIAQRIADFYDGNENAVAYKKAEIIEGKVINYLLSVADSNELKKTRKEINEIVSKILEDKEHDEHEEHEE